MVRIYKCLNQPPSLFYLDLKIKLLLGQCLPNNLPYFLQRTHLWREDCSNCILCVREGGGGARAWLIIVD